MYRNSYQRGMLTVFFSMGAKPLANWETYVKNGYISRFLDQDIKSMVLEIGGTNISTTYMTCPKGNRVLGICMPFLIMIVKNLKKYFSFEVTILDETGTRRRFRVSNFQSSTQVLPLCTVMPIGLSDGWNQIQFNLAEFTRRAYKKQFIEVQKLKINANIRLRRVYFTERLIPEDELPPEYKLYFPLATKGRGKRANKENEIKDDNIKPSTSKQTVEQPVVEEKTSLKEIKNISKASLRSSHKSISHAIIKSEDKIGSHLSQQKNLSTVGSATKVTSKVAPENGGQPINEGSAIEGATAPTDETKQGDEGAAAATDETKQEDHGATAATDETKQEDHGGTAATDETKQEGHEATVATQETIQEDQGATTVTEENVQAQDQVAAEVTEETTVTAEPVNENPTAVEEAQ